MFFWITSDTLHTLSVVFIKHAGGFEEKTLFNSTLRLSSVTGHFYKTDFTSVNEYDVEIFETDNLKCVSELFKISSLMWTRFLDWGPFMIVEFDILRDDYLSADLVKNII